MSGQCFILRPPRFGQSDLFGAWKWVRLCVRGAHFLVTMRFGISFRVFVILFVSLFGVRSASAAEPYRVGDIIEAFAVTDAKGASYAYVPGELSCLLVSYEMSPGKAVNGYLSAKPADYLEKNRAAFVANIFGMPGIGRFFALPKMAKYPHRILLADSATLLERHPVKKDYVTVFSFDSAGVITAIRYLDPEKELDQLFAEAKP